MTLPRDLAAIQQRVSINFQATLPEIAQQEPATFTGYAPKGEAIYLYDYDGVIQTAREALDHPAATMQPH
jgi:hypothetical protein